MKKNKTKADNLILTQKNVNELKKELNELAQVKRKEVIKDLKQARQQGDLSENSQYDAAKQKQGEIEKRIFEINTLLKNYAITSENEDKNIVLIGKTVNLLDLKSNQEVEFKIGTVFDINVNKNIISNVSPLAKAIMKKKVGDRILVKGEGILISYWVKILKVR